MAVARVTREHREQLAKSAKSMSDKTKEKIRDLYGRFERDVRKAKDKSSADRIRDIEQQVGVSQASCLIGRFNSPEWND